MKPNRRNAMLPLAALTGVCGLVAASSGPRPLQFLLTSLRQPLPAGLVIAGGSEIKFDRNTSGETATFTLSSVPGAEYVIAVTGQNNQFSSFF